MATIYSGTNDGQIRSVLNASFAGTRAGTTGSSTEYGLSQGIVGQVFFSGRGGGTFGILRSFFEFDTSGISVAPSAATLRLYGVNYNTADLIAVRSEQSATLANGDLDALYGASTALGNSDGAGAGTLAGISGLTYSAEITSWATHAYNNVAFNATALADMASLSLFKVAILQYDNDHLDITSVDAGGNAISGAYFTETSGTSSDPYIDYTAGTAVTDNAVFFGANF